MVMESIPKRLLITGLPGVGKTTLIKKLADSLRALRPVGFYTEEVRQKRSREGFALVSFDGRRGVLSHVDIRSPFRVGRYGVDVARFEIFLDGIDFVSPKTELIIIDEIGKMECYSERFRTLLQQIFNSNKRVVATIAQKGGGIIEEIKKRQGVTLLELTPGNRKAVFSEIMGTIGGRAK